MDEHIRAVSALLRDHEFCVRDQYGLCRPEVTEALGDLLGKLADLGPPAATYDRRVARVITEAQRLTVLIRAAPLATT